MGTALIPFDDQDHWESWHQLQHKKAVSRQDAIFNRYEVLAKKLKYFAIWPALLAFALFYLIISPTELIQKITGFTEISVLLIGMFLIIASVLLAATAFMMIVNPVLLLDFFDFGFAEKGGLSELLVDKYPLEFDCPSCLETINLAEPWVCGHCKFRHESWINGPIFLGCCDTDCNPKVDGHPIDPKLKHRAQSAFQCPSCADHIMINPKLYGHFNSHTKPHRGVARFCGDTKQPSIGGNLTIKEADVGDLLTKALNAI